MMVSLSALFTPVFTLSLGVLPAHPYSHGSSFLGTSQQVAAAIGTAVAVTVLTSRSSALMEGGAAPSPAFVGGLQWAFGAAAIIGVAVVGLTLLLPSRVPGAAGAGHGDPVAEESASV